MPEPNFLIMSIKLIGGLAIFLYGMNKMTEGLKLVAGSSLRSLLKTLTRNRFSGVLTGAGITAVIQSSSITTVLVVGFISAGLMSLSQSVPVIMGANIGTTVTAQILAFKITKAALGMIALGFALEFAIKKPRPKKLGSILMGLGFIFLGMDIMSDATHPLRTYEPFLNLMQDMRNPLLAIAIGAVFTAMVQSSSATTGIVIVLAGQGLITLENGIALILGANIGTCVTSLLATIGKPREALQAAGVHVLFNVTGVVIWVGLIGPLAVFVRWMSPESAAELPVERLAAETPRQIANAHTVFNVANMLVFIGFTTPMAMLVRKILPDKPPAISTRATPQYLDEMFQQTPDIALERVRLELLHLGGLVQPMVRKAVPAALGGTREDLKQLADWDDDVDTLYDSIYEYIGGLSQYEMSEEQTHRLTELMEVLNSIESLGDIVEANIVPLGIRRLNQHIKMSPDAVTLFQPLVDQVCINVADALTALEKRDIELANRIIGHKLSVNTLADNTFTHLSDSLTGDDRTRVQGIRIEIDLIEMLRRSYYFAKRIAKAVVEMEEGEDAEEAAQPADEIQVGSTH